MCFRPEAVPSLKQLRPAPDYKGDQARYKYAEGDKFANWMRERRKVEAIIGKINGIIGFFSCTRGRL
jgi:hypothetical protein